MMGGAQAAGRIVKHRPSRYERSFDPGPERPSTWTDAMLKPLGAALLGATLLSGCGYFPTPPDPIRLVDSPVDVAGCRSLGSVGKPIRTDGRGPYLYGALTTPVPATSPAALAPYGGFGVQPEADNFAVRLQPLRDEALMRGATDLLLVRRIKRDWSYVEGHAYRCREGSPR
jgi:hypothetical protein